MKLRSTISLTVTLPVLLGIVAVILASALLIAAAIPKWTSIVSEVIVAQEKSSLSSLAQSKANLLDEYMQHLRVHTGVSRAWLQEVFAGTNSTFAVPITPDYSGFRYPSSAPSDVFQQDTPITRMISTSATAWYQPLINSSVYLNPASMELLNQSSLALFPFRSLYLADSEIINLYVGFEQAGFFRTFPYRDLSSYNSLNRVCEAGLQRGQLMQWYDPRCRPWYGLAANHTNDPASANYDLHLTQGYLSSSGLGLLLASAAPIRNASSSQLLGVVAVEMPLDSLEASLARDKTLSNGYMYVYDRRDGNVLMHSSTTFKPKRTAGPQSLLDFEFGSSSSSDAVSFANSYLSLMNSGKNGGGSFMRAGKEWLIRFQATSMQNLTAVTVVPMSDVDAISDDVADQLWSLSTVRIVVLCVTGFVFLVLTIVVVHCASRKIVIPLVALQQHMERIAGGDYSSEIEHQQISRHSMNKSVLPAEIQRLLDTFDGLTVALRLGNEQYLSGNLAVAFANYTKAAALFEKMGNVRGTGVCANNLGNIHYAQKQYEEAAACYRKSITQSELEMPSTGAFSLFRLEVALDPRKASEVEAFMQAAYVPDPEHIQNSTSPASTAHSLSTSSSTTAMSTDAKQLQQELSSQRKLIMSMASRFNNLALTMSALDQLESAEQLLQHAIFMDRITNNVRGLATRCGNLGDIYRRHGNIRRAVQPSEDAFKLAVQSGDLSAIQQASFTMGRLELHLGNDDRALGWFQAVLECSPYLEAAMHVECLSHMIDIHEKHGRSQLDFVKQLRVFRDEVRPQQLRKCIQFVLDMSGSMAGERMADAVRNMRNIYDELVNNLDYVSLVTFNSKVQLVFPLLLKQDHDYRIRSEFDGLQEPTGATAFYDAVHTAVDMLSANGGIADAPDRWIVALTDGADNSSRMKPAVLHDILTKSGLNLIIVSVGELSTAGILKTMTEQTPRGLYIEESASITGSSWSQTVNLHIRGQVVMESY
jgi:tetratricopeptide (TPR) repeat protein